MNWIPGRLISLMENCFTRYMGKRVRSKHILSLLRLRSLSFTKIRNLAQNEYERNKKHVLLKSRPYTMLLDTTNACNLQCPTCMTGRGKRGRPPGMMTLENFKTIVEFVAEYLVLLEFNHWGEPFINPEIFSMIRHAENSGIFTSVSTNGTLLDDMYIEKILKSQLSLLTFSIDGATDEVYKKHRAGGTLDAVLGQMKKLIQTRNESGCSRPFVEWQFIVFRHNEHEMKDAKNMAESIGADQISFINSYCEDVSWIPRNTHFCEPLSSYSSIVSCSSPWTTLTVNWDGGVSPCCWGFYREHDLGNLLESGFEEIWNGKLFVRTREVAGKLPVLNPNENVRILCDYCIMTGKPLHAGRDANGIN